MFKVTKATGAYAALVSVVSGTIMWFNFRPLGLFFCSALAVFWARQYAHLRLQISPLFEEKLRNGARRALELRAARPGLFCALISGLLVLVAVIGHVVSAPYIVVTLLVLSIVISTKYDIKIVADREPVPSACLLDQEVEEFLPEITEANASLLKQVGEDADVSAVYKPDSATVSERPGVEEDDDDDTYSDLLMPQNSIKELEEAEEDRSSSSSDELLLGSEPQQAMVPVAPEASGEIRFKSSHFNANTSSDSDDSISRGLSFDDVPDRGVVKRKSHHHQPEQVRPQQQDQLATLAGNLLTSGNLLSYLTTAVSAAASASAMSQSQPGPASSHGYGTRQQPPNRMTVSSLAGGSRHSYAAGDDSTDEDGDSDFEMLNPDELNNV
uniref:(northern house mosquito) hypothetical protein n=1 Tax=Culex pipiens TaxID=7175 RepID=A0A8D8GP03_CULPI